MSTPYRSKGNATADVFTSLPTQFLESVIPGFSLLSQFLEVSLGVDISTVVSTCFVLAAVIGTFNYAGRAVWKMLGKRLTCSISISSNDKLYEQVMYWVSQQNISVSSRSLKASTSKSNEDGRTGSRRKDEGPSNFYFAEIESSIPPEYTPAYGHHLFWYKRHLILFHREQEHQAVEIFARNTQQEREIIHLRCFGWFPAPIKELLMDAKRLDADQNKSITTIRRSPQGPQALWSLASKRPSRSLETVFMDENIKQELLDDIQEFLDPGTPIFYARRGIPYRRGYLFYGSPGTGKTSLTFSLAGHFGFELYAVSLREPFMSEHKLTQLFASLPTRCIVLLEDVDTCGLEKRSESEHENSRMSDNGKQPRIRQESRPFGSSTITTQGADGITLSGLLNAIDGVASQEGRILIMTSNDPEALDKALVRPGRVDKQIYFSNASKEHIIQIFLSMYSKDDPRDSATSSWPGNFNEQKKSNQKYHKEDHLQSMAAEFADILPHSVFTPAEVQGFLLMRRKNPRKAIEDAPNWREALLAAREAGKNVINASRGKESDKEGLVATGNDQPVIKNN